MWKNRGGEPASRFESVAGRYTFPLARQAPTVWYAPAGLGVPTSEPQPVARRRESPLARDAKLQRLEAVLFLAREPVSSRRLAQHAGLRDGTEARTLIAKLNRLYDLAGRAFRVEEVAGGFQLLTRPKFASWLRRLGHVPGELRLSVPVLETLAVIAYRQPVLRAEIEAIRGVQCGEILRQLMDRDLIRVCGRSDDVGRPYLYGTTKKFLQLFGLPNIDKLPPIGTMPIIYPVNDVTTVGPAVDAEPDSRENSQSRTNYQQREESKVTVTRFSDIGDVVADDPHELPELIVAQARSRRDDDDYDDEYDEEEYDEEEDEDFDDLEDEDYDEDEFDEDEDFDDEDYDEEEDEYDEDEEDWEDLDEEDEEDYDDWDDEEEDWDDEDED